MKVFVIPADKMSEELMTYVDAVIMPGGHDHYPSDKFTIEQLPKDRCMDGSYDNCLSDREYAYQNVNSWADKYEIPTMGICLGLQYLALHHGGTLAPKTAEYNSLSSVNVTFNQSSLSYLYTLSKEEKIRAVDFCEFPEVLFNGVYRTNSFSVKDGNFDIGATSQDSTGN